MRTLYALLLVGATFLPQPVPAATIWVAPTGQVALVDFSDREDTADTNQFTRIRVTDPALARAIQADQEAVRQIGVERIYDADGNDITPPPPVPVYVFPPVTPGALHILTNGTVRLMTDAEQQTERDARPPQVFDRRIIAAGVDLETTDPDRGLIQKDSLGRKWLSGITTDGVPYTVQVAASPEVDFATRQTRKASAETQLAADRANWPRSDVLFARITNNLVTWGYTNIVTASDLQDGSKAVVLFVNQQINTLQATQDVQIASNRWAQAFGTQKQIDNWNQRLSKFWGLLFDWKSAKDLGR